ncbi:hypothetical protein ACILG0_22715 [Pseudomonadota bacterium AL_CKDN230030165-1A_HGKHYDSX7]
MLAAFILMLGLTPVAQAQASAPLQCGVYQHEDRQIQVLSENLIRKSALGGPELLYYAVEAGKLAFYNLDLGLDDEYKLSPDGKSIDVGFDQIYVLKAAVPCARPVELPQTKVWPLCWKADLMTCLNAYNETSLKEMENMCTGGLPFACKKLPELWREAEDLQSDASGRLAALPEGAINVLQQACLKGISASVCDLAAREAWQAGRYLDARQPLQHACAAPIGSTDACALAKSLAPLSQDMLAQSAPAALPRGTFTRPIGTLRSLAFAEDGTVKDGDGSPPMQARLEQGLIRMRHNQGGDFVFKPVGERYLLGVDYWNQLAVFARTGD